MTSKEPWLENWKIEKDLSGGGQGTTYIVKSKMPETDSPSGVLKVLRYQESDVARRRMYREVSSLTTLHSAGCRVPKVLGSNTQDFENAEVPLFFVMEYIDGDTLYEFVSRNQGIPLAQACDIIFSLCETMSIAQHEEIIHRDLKPENIIICNLQDAEKDDYSPKPVIVDYGLSFNNKDEDNVTRNSETLDNKFLSLPERRIPGGDRRDPRSDLTGLCGIFYYCITNHPPVDLLGPDNNPPHRRPGHSVREKLSDTPIVRQLEVFFDRGFSTNIDCRFQTIDELSNRLQEVLSPSARTPREDPVAFAKRTKELLMQHDRNSQLGAYRKIAGQISKKILIYINNYSKKLSPFAIKHVGNPKQLSIIEGYDDLNIECTFEMREINNVERILISYIINSQGYQSTVFRALFRKNRQEDMPVIIGDWKPIVRFDGLSTPDMKVINQDCDDMLTESMETLQRDILSLQNNQTE